MIASTLIVVLLALFMGFLGRALDKLSRARKPLQNTSASPPINANSEVDDGNDIVIEKINSRLPQTQCAQCGYPGCRPYAEAIVLSDAPINQCPPGGDVLIAELAQLLGTDARPLNTQHGEFKPDQIAIIDETECIGCTLCILACPVDAIVGASKLMHTVVADQCTGCELCLPPCPVDCINLIPVAQTISQWQWPKPQ